MVGVAADKAALVHDYLAEDADEAFADGARPARAPAAPGPARLRPARRAARLRPQAQHARLPRLAAGLPDPRAHPAPAEARRRSSIVERVRRARRAARRRPTPSWRRSRASARSGRRTSARAFAGCRRSTSWTATCRPDDDRAAAGAAARRTKEDIITEVTEEQHRGPRGRPSRSSTSSSRSATTSSTRITAPARSSRRSRRTILGEKREYLTIKILHNDMTVMVPSENAAMAGLRRVIDEETVKKVLAVLQDDVSEMPKNWNRRFKHNRDKIKTGDIYELAEVVRNLAIREDEKGLSTGEKQMFTRAKKILASELMYALEMDEEEAEEHLDELLAKLRRAARCAVAREVARGETRRWRSRCSWPPAVANALGRRAQGVRRAGGPSDARLEPRRAARGAGDRADRRRAARRARAAPAGDDRRGRRRRALALGARGAGGRRRRPDDEPVLVHDAARPLLTPALFERVRSRALAATAAATRSIAAAPVTDTIKRARRRRPRVRETLDRARAVGGADAAGLPPRGARARAGAARRRARRGDRRRLARRAGGRRRARRRGAAPRTSRSRRRVDLRARASCCCARTRLMLTDYHVHLRPDGAGTTAAEYFTPANAERYREAAERARDRRARRLRARLPLPPGARRLAAPVLARERASTTSTPTATFVREADRPAARHRGRLRPGPRGPHGEPARGARRGTTWSARSTSSATSARRPSTTTTSGDALGRSREGLAPLLRDARRGGAQRPVRHPRPPRPREGLGRRAAAARGRPAPLLRAGDRGDRRVGHRDRGLDRRAAQAGRRALPGARRSWRCASTPAARSRCPATPTCPSTSATATSDALELLADAGRPRALRVRAARAAAGADRMTA